MKQKQNFSLVELVLVAAVLFVGIGMVISAATEGAAEKNIACRANLKKFATAMTQYAEGNGGYLLFPGLNWNEKKGLGSQLGAYFSNQENSKNPELFTCPADERPMDGLQEGGSKFWMQTPEGKWTHYKVSYSVNLVVTGMPNNQYMKPHQIKAMANPAQCFLFSDALVRDNPGDLKRFAFRHEEKANAAFADGSIRDLAEAQTPKWQSSQQQAFWVGGAE